MTGFEPIVTALSAAFTAGVLGYLWHVVRRGHRPRGNPELAAKGMREAPYERLDNIMSGRRAKAG
jgi:hypothetical protein